jgi:hypothetical protein
MTSINEQRVRQRVSAIYDMAHGGQGTEKSIREYVKALMKSVDIHREAMGSAEDFLKDIGSI